MRRILDRWRARAAALAVLTAALVSPAVAGPVSTTGTQLAKIEEIEKAGAALQKGQVDEAYKLLQEAVKKKPDLPPARLMLARLYMSTNTKEGQQQGRAILETAAGENPNHPEIYLTCGSLALGEGRLSEALLNCQRAFELASSGKWSA